MHSRSHTNRKQNQALADQGREIKPCLIFGPTQAPLVENKTLFYSDNRESRGDVNWAPFWPLFGLFWLFLQNDPRERRSIFTR